MFLSSIMNSEVRVICFNSVCHGRHVSSCVRMSQNYIFVLQHQQEIYLFFPCKSETILSDSFTVTLPGIKLSVIIKRNLSNFRGKSKSGDLTQKNLFSVSIEKKTTTFPPLLILLRCFIIMIRLTRSYLSQVLSHISYSILSPIKHKSSKPLFQVDTKTTDKGWMMMKGLLHVIYLPSYDYILLLN